MFSGAPFKILANAVDAAAFKFDSEKREALRKNSIYQKRRSSGACGTVYASKNHTFLLDILLRWRRWSRMRG